VTIATIPIELYRLSEAVFCLIEPKEDGFRCWIEYFTDGEYYRSQPVTITGDRSAVDGYLQALVEFGELSFTVYRPPVFVRETRLRLAELLRPKTDFISAL